MIKLHIRGFQPRIPDFMAKYRIVLTPVTILWDSNDPAPFNA